MVSTEIKRSTIALTFLVLYFSPRELCQEKPLILSDQFLPTLSHSREIQISSPSTYPSQNLKWFGRVEHDGNTRFLRLHIRVNQIPTSPTWSLHVFNENNIEVEVLAHKQFSDKTHYLEAWTRKIPGRLAIIELLATDKIDGFVVSIDRYNYQASEPSEKAFVGQDDRQDLVLAYGRDHAFYKWGLPIASILFLSAEEKKETGCTAFLISKDLLMTNQHCVSQPWQVPTIQVILGYESNSSRIERFSVSQIVLQNQALDYSVLRLNRPAETWSTVSLETSPKPTKDEPLILIQVPPLETKKIAVRKCKVQYADAKGRSNELTDFYHLCDSEGGSSGSPLMDLASGKVVGLHHAGQYDPGGHDYHNLGVRMQLILADVASQKPEICGEITGCRTN